MVKIEIDIKQLKKAISQLPAKERTKLLAEFKDARTDKEWSSILRSVDRQLKKFPISRKEIENEIKAYRKRKRKNA